VTTRVSVEGADLLSLAGVNDGNLRNWRKPRVRESHSAATRWRLQVMPTPSHVPKVLPLPW
jgi:hypothetical protein